MKKASRQYRRNQRETEKVRKAAPRKAKVRAIKRGAKQVAKREAEKEVRGGFTPPTGPANPGVTRWEADGVIADAWGKSMPVLSVNRTKTPYPPIYFANVRTPSGYPGKAALVTGAGYPIDAAIISAYRAAGRDWGTPKTTIDRVARSFR